MTGIIAQCIFCKRKIKGAINCTSNFIKHLKKKHPLEHQNYMNLQNNKVKMVKPISSPKQLDFDKKIVNFIVNNISPISIVENKAFIDLFDGTGLKVKSVPKINQLVDTEFDLLVTKIKSASSMNKYFCVTADVWSGAGCSFLGYTCHWLDEKFNRFSVALACKRFSNTDANSKIAKIIFELNQEFGLNEFNTIATVTDNGSNYVENFKEFGVLYTEEGYLNDDQIWNEILKFDKIQREGHLHNHQICTCHTLNLIGSIDYINIIRQISNIYDIHKQVFNLNIFITYKILLILFFHIGNNKMLITVEKSQLPKNFKNHRKYSRNVSYITNCNKMEFII